MIEVSKETFESKPEGLQMRNQMKHLSKEIALLDESIQQKEYQIDSISTEVKSTD